MEDYSKPQKIATHSVQLKELNVLVRPLVSDDESAIHSLVRIQGWGITPPEIRDQLLAYPNDFLGAFVEDNKLVGTCSMALLSDDLAYLSYVITHPDYQGRGLASYLLHALEDHAVPRNVILDSVDDFAPFYEQKGYKKSSIAIAKLKGVLGEKKVKTAESIIQSNVEILDADNIDMVLNFDHSICAIHRDEFLKLWMFSDNSIVRCYINDTRGVEGVIVLRKTAPSLGYDIVSSFYVNNSDIATALLNEIASIPRYHSIPIVINFPTENKTYVTQIFSGYGFSETGNHKNIRMYKITDIYHIVDWEKVISVTNTDVVIV